MNRAEVAALIRAAGILAPEPMAPLIIQAGRTLAKQGEDLDVAGDWLADIMPTLRGMYVVSGMLLWMSSALQEHPRLAQQVTKPGYFWDYLMMASPLPPAEHAANLLVHLRRQIGS